MSTSCNTFSEPPNSHYELIASFCTLGLLLLRVQILAVLQNSGLSGINFSDFAYLIYVCENSAMNLLVAVTIFSEKRSIVTKINEIKL